MKTKNTHNEEINYAPNTLRFFSLIVDLFVLGAVTYWSVKYFDLLNSLANFNERSIYIAIFCYFYFLLIVVPINIFSQSLGMFIFGLKAVSKIKLKRLGKLASLNHCLFLRKYSESIVVSIR